MSLCLTYLHGGLFLANIHSVFWNRIIRVERAWSHNWSYIYRAACLRVSVFYVVVTGVCACVCVRERACAFSQGLIDRVPVHPLLYDDNIFIWLFVLLCACIWTVKA